MLGHDNAVAGGRFITFEGGEGVGKSTQVRVVAQALAERGIRSVVTREPGGTPNAEAIRDLLMRGADNRWSARAEVLLFAAARADHVERVIEPALQQGQWVLCDRFVDSSRAYQSEAGDVSDRDVMAVHRFGSRGMLPDRTLLLVLDPHEGCARAHDRDGQGDRFASRDAHALAHRFATIAAAEPERVRSVDAAGPPSVVTARILAALADYLP